MKKDSRQLNSKTATKKPMRWLIRIAPALDKVGILFLVATFVAVACLLLFMLWIDPRRPVARISNQDGTTTILSTHAFQRRLEMERTRSVNQQKERAAKAKIHPADFEPDYRPLATLSFAAGVIDRLTREVLIQEETSRRGITVNDDEIDLTIARVYGLVVWSKEAPVPTNSSSAAWLEAKPEMREQARQTHTEAQRRLKKDGLPNDYRQIVRLELLDEKLRDAFYAETPVEQDRVVLKLIRLETEADAQTAAALLGKSETFDIFYNRVTQGMVSGATGTLRDWSSRAELDRDYNIQFGQKVMSLHAGEVVSQPLVAAHGWYLVKVDSRELRTMSEDWRRQRGLDAMNMWFARQNTRVVQDPGWMKRVPPTPNIPNQQYAGELPPPGSGMGPAGKSKIPGMPSIGGKESPGAKQPLAGRTRHNASSMGEGLGPVGAAATPGQSPTRPASIFEQLQNPIVPGRSGVTESAVPSPGGIPSVPQPAAGAQTAAGH